MVDRYGGAANKNIGEAFLLVWKFPKDEVRKFNNFSKNNLFIFFY